MNGPSLVFDETVRVHGDAVVLPGKLKLRTVHTPVLPTDGRDWAWTGAARIVDVTRKITARTGPQHRRYVAHLSAKADTPSPAIPESRTQIVGVDCGVTIPVATSDGDAHHLPEHKALQAEIRTLQQAKARCDYGSRQWKTRTRRIRTLNKRLHNLRVNGSRQIAAQLARGGHAEIAVEDLKLKNMVASAKGTVEHPGRRVAAKRGLNRSLHRVAIGRLHQHIERACQRNVGSPTVLIRHRTLPANAINAGASENVRPKPTSGAHTADGPATPTTTQPTTPATWHGNGGRGLSSKAGTVRRETRPAHPVLPRPGTNKHPNTHPQ